MQHPDMIKERLSEKKAGAKGMREANALCDSIEVAAAAGLLKIYIDETARRTWFLFETSLTVDSTGH